MTLPLTEKQEQLWRYIASCERSPTYDEMAVALGNKVRGSGVASVVDQLEAKGYVRRTPGRARAIIAVDPERPAFDAIPTSTLLAELERRGILLGCAR